MTLTRRGRALRDLTVGVLIGALFVGLVYGALVVYEHRRCAQLAKHIKDNPFAYTYYCTEAQP